MRFWNQGLQYRLVPLVALLVVYHEITVELPIGPAETTIFGGLADEGIPADAALQGNLVIGAEFAQKDGAMMFLTPLRDAIEVALDDELLFWLAPGDVMPTANLFAKPKVLPDV